MWLGYLMVLGGGGEVCMWYGSNGGGVTVLGVW